MSIALEYAPLYANFFNISSLKEIIYQKQPEYITNVLEKSEFWNHHKNMTFKDMFNIAYDMLVNFYRCEYTYKNKLFIREIMEKNHPNAINIFTEINICLSKADMLVVNGTLTIYEMKTEIDSFARLAKQLEDYTKTVDKVYVVTSEKKLNLLLKQLDYFEKVGIMVISDDNRMEVTEYKKAASDVNSLSPEYMFNTLNESEISYLFPKLTYLEAKNAFLEMNSPECHRLLKSCLAKRKSYEPEFVSSLPIPLKMAGFKISRLNKKERNCFLNKMGYTILG